jgi:hypothetical protein
MIVIEWPTASSCVYPNIRQAAEFQDKITPFRSLEMTASSKDSKMAASGIGLLPTS